jgi:hypothetical protein
LIADLANRSGGGFLLLYVLFYFWLRRESDFLDYARIFFFSHQTFLESAKLLYAWIELKTLTASTIYLTQ